MNKIYKVKKVFRDKNNPETKYAVGTLIVFDDEKRAKEALEKGLIEETTLVSVDDADRIVNYVKEKLDDDSSNQNSSGDESGSEDPDKKDKKKGNK